MAGAKKIKGLTQKQAAKLLSEFGLNELRKKRQYWVPRIFIRQFANLMVWILVAASLISYGIGETLNFWVINSIIFFIIILGFIQEYKAERAIEALRAIMEPTTTVIRDGRLRTIASKFVVPGDWLSLEMGDRVPADAEVMEATALRADESMLTGESEPVSKAKGDTLYAGTQVVYGRLFAVVRGTGMKTKLGGIAAMIQQKEPPTPLQVRFEQMGRMLAIVAIVASLVILAIGIVKGASMAAMLIVALSLAVAAVPEGLPFTMTLALSFGMRRMAQKKAVVRRMMAVETLGSTTVICSDKTGTLTKNEMTVQSIWLNGVLVDVTGAGYRPVGEFSRNGKLHKSQHLNDFLRAAVLCNNAQMLERSGRWETVGDPTELALLTVGGKAGLSKERMETHYRRAEEILFSSQRKMMTTLHQHAEGYWIFSKGAPEEILKHCTHWRVSGKQKKLTAKDREAIATINHQLARRALRVLAIAEKRCSRRRLPTGEIEKKLVFLGLVGMEDPPRPEVKQAIQTCNSAGISVLMVTGDNEHTALSIAEQIGMPFDKRIKAVTGTTLDTLSDGQLSELLKTVRVFARTQPEHKLRLVNLLKKQGHIVAMTGDGINDAPALKQADIGIAMGIKGTDVAKEACDMILKDDNFTTIVTAVKEGRRIYRNIEKFTSYLISRNFTEVILIFLGIIFFDFEFLPLLALHILLINAFAEEMPAIALGLDEAPDDIMREPPRPRNEPILNRFNAFVVFSIALFMALVAFVIFLSQDPLNNIGKARTMVFAVIVLMVIFNTFNFRSMRQSSFAVGLFANRALNYSVLLIAGVTLALMYHPATQRIFSFASLEFWDWFICLIAAFSTFVYMEIIKWYRTRIA